jgi:hypothetical protein
VFWSHGRDIYSTNEFVCQGEIYAGRMPGEKRRQKGKSRSLGAGDDTAFAGLLRSRGLLGDDAGVHNCADAGESLEIHVPASDFDEHEGAVGVEAFVGDSGFI